ncbi:IS110 family RNA-guided transposase [Gracilibacillus timonensis]|uniref:IS110 family transposase n=1 Tax=Gracilibacillus timonensis TaxID=1816696 RepID=UPI0008243F9F|nr:IS110 family transposase [Gracilibacillus timonensis]
MDSTQNNRLEQITDKTLIIGIDVAKDKHVARAIDDHGRDLAKRLVFENSLTGFQSLLDWAEHLAEQQQRPHFMFGMEPTGHYWLNLAYHLKAQGLHAVVVNPTKVKRTKELDDDSPTKNDTKDAKVIAQVVRAGRFHEPILLEGLYAELREGMKLHDIMEKDLTSIKAQVQNALDRYFPEFTTVFKDWTKKTPIHFLKKGYLPVDIASCSEEALLAEIKEAAKRGVGIKQARSLKHAAETSVGMTVGLTMAREEISYLIDQYVAIKGRIEAHEARLEELVLQVPGARQMIAIKGVGVMTVAGFFAEVGDLSNYQDPRQIIKLAGLNLQLNQSGKFKGQTTITKRGRRRLRSILYLAARPLSANNEGFKQLHHYYRNRPDHPLTGKESFVALGRKLIKIFYVMGTRNCAFDGERMMRDIPSLRSLQKVA